MRRCVNRIEIKFPFAIALLPMLIKQARSPQILDIFKILDVAVIVERSVFNKQLPDDFIDNVS